MPPKPEPSRALNQPSAEPNRSEQAQGEPARTNAEPPQLPEDRPGQSGLSAGLVISVLLSTAMLMWLGIYLLLKFRD